MQRRPLVNIGGRTRELPSEDTLPQCVELASLTYAATVSLDFLGASVQILALTGNVTLSTVNRAVGRSIQVILQAGSAARTITWESGWKAYGAALPTTLAANKEMMLSLVCVGVGSTDVRAGAGVEP